MTWYTLIQYQVATPIFKKKSFLDYYFGPKLSHFLSPILGFFFFIYSLKFKNSFSLKINQKFIFITRDFIFQKNGVRHYLCLTICLSVINGKKEQLSTWFTPQRFLEIT